VPGEKVVPPSSVVQLICRLRYVYPTSSTTGASTTALPNGSAAHSDPKAGAVKSESAEPTESVAEVEDAVTKVTEGEETVDEKAEIKKQVEELKEKVVNGSENAGKLEKEVGTKGKAESKSERKWAPNGYAHAPRWPLVSNFAPGSHVGSSVVLGGCRPSLGACRL
jgi:translocation protein SEC63